MRLETAGYLYSAYGLCISSYIELPILEKIENKDSVQTPDIYIIKNTDQQVFKNFIEKADLNEVFINLRNQAYIRISNGEVIEVREESTTDKLKLSLSLLHLPLACLLYQRGFLCLHASAVRIDNKTHLFCGKSGVGKSSIASKMLVHGKLITEDIAVIDARLENTKIIPSFPSIKLDDKEATPLKSSLSIIDDGKFDSLGRSSYKLDEAKFTDKPQNIDQCFFLEWGHKNSIIELEKTEAMKYLFKYMVPPPQGNSLSSDKLSFLNSTKLLNQIRLFRVTRKQEKRDDLFFLSRI